MHVIRGITRSTHETKTKPVVTLFQLQVYYHKINILTFKVRYSKSHFTDKNCTHHLSFIASCTILFQVNKAFINGSVLYLSISSRNFCRNKQPHIFNYGITKCYAVITGNNAPCLHLCLKTVSNSLVIILSLEKLNTARSTNRPAEILQAFPPIVRKMFSRQIGGKCIATYYL